MPFIKVTNERTRRTEYINTEEVERLSLEGGCKVHFRSGQELQIMESRSEVMARIAEAPK